MKPSYKKQVKEPESFRMSQAAIPGIPVLEATNGTSNPEQDWNFINFTERMAQYVEVTFGDISKLFRKLEYPTYELPDYKPEDFTQENDPLGIKREEMREQVKLRAKRMAALEDNKPKVYALIKGQISRESFSRVQALPGFSQVESHRDPLQLWGLLMGVHLVDSRDLDIDTAKAKAQQAFGQCRMNDAECRQGTNDLRGIMWSAACHGVVLRVRVGGSMGVRGSGSCAAGWVGWGVEGGLMHTARYGDNRVIQARNGSVAHLIGLPPALVGARWMGEE